MRKLIIISSLFFSFYIHATFIPEDALFKNFNKIVDSIETYPEEEKASNYNFIGLAFLNGFFTFKQSNGFTSTISVKQDPKKAFEFFKKSHELSNINGSALLGMAYSNGIGVNEDLLEAEKILFPIRSIYTDASSAYGITIHKLLRKGVYSSDSKEKIGYMIESLEYGANNDEIIALNSLYQIYSEGTFVSMNKDLANSYRQRVKEIVDKKNKLWEAIEDARSKSNSYESIVKIEEPKGNRRKLITFGLLATTMYFQYDVNMNLNNTPCVTGCSPLSTIDLINLGIL